MGLRKLDRVDNSFGTDLICVLSFEQGQVECSVLDFNSLGFRLSLARESFLQILNTEIFSAKIMYGSLALGSLTYPAILRSSSDKSEVVLVPSQKSNLKQVDRSTRADVPMLLEPVLIGEDPVRLKEKLIMRIDNISATGFRAKCSLSNRHLFEGQKLNGFSVFLPGLGSFECDFSVVSIRYDSQFLVVRSEFSNLKREHQKLIKNFFLLCIFSEKEDEDTQLLGPAPKVSHLLRVRRIDDLKEMPAVMALRFSAYKGANKLREEASVNDMMDEFDKNSIILGAFIGSKMVGTIRIIFSKEGSAFPLESFFPFPETLSRQDCVEVSKLAIDPALQGSDVLFRLFQSFALEFMPKKECALLMATEALSKNYISIGARRISKAVPHPVLKEESLCLFLLETNRLKRADMSALTWLFFAREIVHFMARFGFAKKTRMPMRKVLALPMELATRLMKRLRRRKKSKAFRSES